MRSNVIKLTAAKRGPVFADQLILEGDLPSLRLSRV
jgi:hypothetical protein